MATTIETRSSDVSRGSPSPSSATKPRLKSLTPYLLLGVLFGIILVKAEVLSWYRIREMFLFQSFHMYGVLGSAFVTALISLALLKRAGARARNGQAIAIPPKVMGRGGGYRYWMGGGTFGIGWALCGACPGPLFGLVGSGYTVYIATGAAAIVGTWTYGILRDKLPH